MLPDDFNTPPNTPPPRPDMRFPPVQLNYQPPPQARPASNTNSWTLRLFRVFGITVFLHYSWFIVAIYFIQRDKQQYGSIAWSVAAYLSLFVIVLLHEFGHALACRSVGGKAERIVLWPLGGVAFVSPPPRAGAMLWSIVAGPLVNVLLWPGLYWLKSTCAGMSPDIAGFTSNLWWINNIILIFNMLPIYPLDGGQILQSLLWFIMGRAWSLMVAACIGILGALGLLGLAAWSQSWWTAIMAIFAGSMAWRGITAAKLMLDSQKAPRRQDAACPNCGKHPPVGDRWKCSCGNSFDTFATNGQCPRCGTVYTGTSCLDCGKAAPIQAWRAASASAVHANAFNYPPPRSM